MRGPSKLAIRVSKRFARPLAPSGWLAVSTSYALLLLCNVVIANPLELINHYCVDCHNNVSREGSITLESLSTFEDASPETWSAIGEKIQLRQMPPEDSEQPTAEEKQQIVAWIAEAFRSQGRRVVNRLDWPNYGNYVDHAALFHTEPHPAPATRVRLWRKRPAAYTHKNRQGIQPFSMLPGQQISDFSTLFSVDESSAEIVLRNAQQWIESITQVDLKDGKLRAAKGTHAQAVYFPILHPEEAPTPEAFSKVITWQFYQALDRHPTEQEVQRIRKLYDLITDRHGRTSAASAVLVVPLLKPESLYRLELGAGERDEHGRRRLTKHEIIQAVHHTFSDTHPHNAIHTAKKEELATRDQVAQLVRKMIGSDRPNARILHFFDEYFDYRKAPTVFKEVPAGVDFNASVLSRDTQRLIDHIVSEDKDVLRRLLTTQQTFIGDESDLPRNHRIYNLPGDWKWRDGLIDLDPQQRAGVLTQPAWLVAHSGNFDNDPVRRGKWILERLLGGVVPDLPISVCAVVPEDKTKTLRQRFDTIRNDEYCWKCHRQMNPLGMPFESYDHFGRYRMNEQQQPVVTTGAVVGIGDPSVDGNVSDAIELIHRLAKSKRAQEVFVRYAFRYFLGRNETLRDAKTLQEANLAYEHSGGSFRELVISLVSSDSFLYRTLD